MQGDLKASLFIVIIVQRVSWLTIVNKYHYLVSFFFTEIQCYHIEQVATAIHIPNGNSKLLTLSWGSVNAHFSVYNHFECAIQ